MLIVTDILDQKFGLRCGCHHGREGEGDAGPQPETADSGIELRATRRRTVPLTPEGGGVESPPHGVGNPRPHRSATGTTGRTHIIALAFDMVSYITKIKPAKKSAKRFCFTTQRSVFLPLPKKPLPFPLLCKWSKQRIS